MIILLANIRRNSWVSVSHAFPDNVDSYFREWVYSIGTDQTVINLNKTLLQSENLFIRVCGFLETIEIRGMMNCMPVKKRNPYCNERRIK
jgi:hypothetical protein